MIKIVQQVFPELFDAAQRYYGIGHSKLFVDAVPKRGSQDILQDYQKQRNQSDFDIEQFIQANFSLPKAERDQQKLENRLPIRDYVNSMWSLLERSDDNVQPNSSLLSLPNPYIVPGGRFREIYYWDSYFTMLGLARAGRGHMVQYMVDNFAYLIDLVGHIPNGNRNYYCTRSQPPFFALMVELLAELEDSRATILVKYLPHLRKEYDFWMRGHEQLTQDNEAKTRVIRIGNSYANRYWDDSDLPRAEGYMEDIELASAVDRDNNELYRDIRAAAESGWDFSARWFSDDAGLGSIHTTDVIPVDLNCLMHNLESVIAQAYGYAGDLHQQAEFEGKASARKELIQTLFFNQEKGFFCDLKLPNLDHSPVLSLAGSYPLYFKLATTSQANTVAQNLNEQFLRVGGWVNSLAETEQQWDSPNGWAPLQWMTYCGLKNYRFTADANEGARRWVNNNLTVYQEHGALLEKYNVETLGKIAEGGEYDVQHGFGWTNAILLIFLEDLNIDEHTHD